MEGEPTGSFGVDASVKIESSPPPLLIKNPELGTSQSDARTATDQSETESGPEISVEESTSVNPTTKSESERKATETALNRLFPNLTEKGELGQRVIEALMQVVTKERISMADLKSLAEGGIIFRDRDEELSSDYQPVDAPERLKWLAGAYQGQIWLYPAFFDSSMSVEKQANVLAHELGHLMEKRVVERVKEGDSTRERMVDPSDYFASFGTRPTEWHGMYVEIQFQNNNQEKKSEMLAEDIGTYLLSSTAKEWATRRISIMPQSAVDQYRSLLEQNQWDQPPLSQLLGHAEEVMAYLDSKIGGDRRFVVKGDTDVDDSSDIWLPDSYSGSPLSGVHSGQVDMDMLANFYDRVFGVKPLL